MYGCKSVEIIQSLCSNQKYVFVQYRFHISVNKNNSRKYSIFQDKSQFKTYKFKTEDILVLFHM